VAQEVDVVDAQQFDGLASRIGRRGAMALLALFGTPMASEAGKKGKKQRRRKRRKKKSAALLRQCLEQCGESCNCIYDTSGEIQCTGNFEAVCAEECSSDDDCDPETSNGCFTAIQLSGSGKKSRFDCDYAEGVCVALGSC
jgi:hypothetical protein